MTHSCTTARRLLFAALAALMLTGADASADGERYRAIVERHATPLVDSGVAPSVVVGVLHEGQVEHYGFGQLAADDARTPDAHTLYEIGSITKVFTATLLAEGQLRGELAIDDPLSAHLPEGVAAPTFGEGEEITLGFLADHRSGLAALPTNLGMVTMDDPYAAYDEAKLWDYLDGLRLMRSPGERYAYSNLGAGLLGTLVARAAESTYADLVRARITGPLEMPDTVIDLSDEQQARFAPPHHMGGAPSTNWHFDALAGAGALRSTTTDMLTFAAAQLDPDASPLADAIRLTQTRRAEATGTPTSVALGWHIAGDGSTLAHSGGTNGYRTALFVSPPLDLAVIVMANTTDDRVSAVAERIVQSLAGLNPPPIEIERLLRLPAEDLDRLVGVYTGPVGTYVITREGASLRAKLNAQPAHEVFAQSPSEFEYQVVEAKLVFELPEDGGATAVTLHQNGLEMRFERGEGE